MVRSLPDPSSRTNFRSFLLFFTASHSFTFTTLKSDFAKVSKSTNSSNSGSIFTLERSSCTLGADTPAAAASNAFGLDSAVSALLSFFFASNDFIVGTFSATILKRALITSNGIYRYFRLIIIPFLALKFAFYNSIGVLFDVFGVNS